jgi:hypothetical protein
MYLLDSDVFIQAKNLHYRFDTCPGFWDWLDAAYASATVGSVQKVRDELEALQDDLSDWAKARPTFFLQPDAQVVAGLTATSTWLQGSRYDAPNQALFLAGADFYLVGHAHASLYTVVTHEKPSHGKKVKIPDACNAMSVNWMSVYDLLEREGVRLVLG